MNSLNSCIKGYQSLACSFNVVVDMAQFQPKLGLAEVGVVHRSGWKHCGQLYDAQDSQSSATQVQHHEIRYFSWRSWHALACPSSKLSSSQAADAYKVLQTKPSTKAPCLRWITNGSSVNLRFPRVVNTFIGCLNIRT